MKATPPPASVIDRGPPDPVPLMFNMGRHTFENGTQHPDKISLIVRSDKPPWREEWTFAALRDAVRGTMTGLGGAGIKSGDRVLLRVGHSVDFPILFFALVGMGAIPVPTSAELTQREVTALADDLAPALTVAAPGIAVPAGPVLQVEASREFRGLPATAWAPTRAEDPAYIIYTSGTGGRPRGVVHAHRAAWARRMMWRDWYDLRTDDRMLHAGAFNWTYTLGTGLTDPWAAGATAIIHGGQRDRRIWADLVAAEAPTIFAAVPGVYRQILASGVDLEPFRALRHCLSAGERLPERLKSDWRDATGLDIFGALGMSEVSTYISASPDNPRPRPQRGRRIAILSETSWAPALPGATGRLAVSRSDPGLMLGYWRGRAQPALPLEGEWFVTGDLARIERDGSVSHQGRADDVLNAQGYRVSAREIEDAVLAHPAIIEVAALALPVRRDVEVLAAFAVAAGDHPEVTPEDLAQHCADRLARYKCPREIRIVSALPRSANGKILKRQLAAEHGWKEA